MIAGQLTIDDELNRVAGDVAIPRLGETPEWGYTLLRLLAQNGWELAITTPFAGGIVDAPPGVLVIATRGALEVRRVGESVAAVASDVVKEALWLQGRSIGEAA